MSALLAVERFADDLLGSGFQAADVVRLLLGECRNLTMPGLVTGLLVRHPDRAGDLLDAWLSRPQIWGLEAARAAAERRLHVQGPDPGDLPGRDRRRLRFHDVAASITVQAVLDADRERLASLAAIADELVRRARDLSANKDDADRYMATVQGWAGLFRPENHHPRQAADGLIIEYQPPAEIAGRLAPAIESRNRARSACAEVAE